MGGAAIQTKDFNGFGHGQHDHMGMGAGGGGFGSGGMRIDNRFNSYGEHMDMEYVDGGMMLGQGNYSQYSGRLLDGMTLSSDFLGEYYTNVSTPNCSENSKCDQEFCLQG